MEVAPELDVEQWMDGEDLDLASLRGRVVLLEAFQMLCPACVTHALPQAQRVWRQYARDDLVVIGIHTVFEHHDAMTPVALAAFLSEFRITFPVAVDRHEGDDRIPATMRRYDLQGTPSQVLIDRTGRVRAKTFGTVEDLALGTRIGRLLAEPSRPTPDPTHPTSKDPP